MIINDGADIKVMGLEAGWVYSVHKVTVIITF